MAVSHDEDNVLLPNRKDSSILMEGVDGLLSCVKAREFVAFWLLDGMLFTKWFVQLNDVQDVCSECCLGLIWFNVGLVRKKLGDF